MDGRPPSEEGAPPATEERKSALHATLGIASSAASMVLYPYVTAGRAAYQATSYAVHAPIKITRYVKDSLLGTPSDGDDSDEAAYDLFGERSGGSDEQETRAAAIPKEEEEEEEEDEVVTDLLAEEYASIIDADDRQEEEQAELALSDGSSGRGAVSQLLFLPARLVSSGVSTAVAIPGSLISYSGRKISGAVSTSQSLATTALVVSSGAVARTSFNVAQGLTYGAFSTASFTATKLSGAVGTSVRTVGYVIPTSVSNAVWQGVGATGNASVSVVSYAIAVPSYRMLAALIPDLSLYFSERDFIEKTREVVLLLVKVLGPQNALYLLKFVYETVNSDEAYDMFLLCHDIVRESLDRENYRRAGSTIGASTGVSTTLVPVVRELFSMIPSAEELFDAFAFVADVSEEVLSGLVASPSSSFEGERFEYIDDNSSSENDDDVAADDSESGYSTISTDAFELDRESDGEVEDDGDERDAAVVGASVSDSAVGEGIAMDGFGERSDSETTSSSPPVSTSSSSRSSDQPSMNSSGGLLDVGVSFFSKVCDSDEAASLFNTFGDFLDVLLVD
ncbi:hypothetical protein Gpo141_00004777 [Globisporangium polare]